MNNPSFVPRILLCGEEAEFFSRVGQRPFKIVGKVQFSGEVDGQPFNFLQDGKIFLDGKSQPLDALVKIIPSADFDYLVIGNFDEYRIVTAVLRQMNIISPKIISDEQFAASPAEFFCDVNANIMLIMHLKNIGAKTLLDMDGYLAKGQIFTKMANDFTEIDCLADKPLPLQRFGESRLQTL